MASSPLVDCRTVPKPERRRSRRRIVEGRVRIVCEDNSLPPIEGHLIDGSRDGFRAVHLCAALATGQLVRFKHPHASGRAKVIWTRILADYTESGFLVLSE